MISYHNPVTKRNIDIFPILDGSQLKHVIRKRNEDSEEEKRIFALSEGEKFEKKSQYLKKIVLK